MHLCVDETSFHAQIFKFCFRLLSFSCWRSSGGTPWILKSTSGIIGSATSFPVLSCWTCHIGDKRIFCYKLSPVFWFTTFAKTVAWLALGVEYFSGWSNKLQCGTTTFNRFDKVPLVALSCREVRLLVLRSKRSTAVKNTVLSSFLPIFHPPGIRPDCVNRLARKRRSNVIKRFRSSRTGFFYIVLLWQINSNSSRVALDGPQIQIISVWVQATLESFLVASSLQMIHPYLHCPIFKNPEFSR